MIKGNQKLAKRTIRHNRVRSVVSGTSQRPRLAVFRANTHIYAQLIDDASGKTLVAASSLELKSKDKKSAQASEVGKLLAKKSAEKSITTVVFDRGGFA